MIRRIRQGELITAHYLNDIGDSVNQLIGPVNAPRQVDKPPAGDIQNEDAESETPEAYIEQERTTDTVQVFDQDDTNYAEIARFTRVSFQNGKGQSLTFVFNNPEV